MKSVAHLGTIPAGEPLPADDITELHAGRLLLLLRYCGTAKAGGPQRIEGLTKLAKLDFFVRYPDAFNRIAAHLNKTVAAATMTIESPMIRHHYGPWDKRYYQILPFLESRGLIEVSQVGETIVFSLTAAGRSVAEALGAKEEFAATHEQMKRVRSVLGNRSGSTLKRLIYEVFTNEVTERGLGEIIS